MCDEIPEDSGYRRALEYVRDALAEFPESFGCSIAEFQELDTVSLQIQLIHGVETIMPSPNQVYHHVSDEAANYLYFASETVPDAYDAALEICVRNLINGAPLPNMLRQFIVDKLTGKFKPAKRLGSPPSRQFPMRWLIYSQALFLADAFEIPITRNDGSSEHSACDVLVKAASEHGVELKYTTIRDWCNHKDYKNFRIRADALRNYAKDVFLSKQGILRRRVL